MPEFIPQNVISRIQWSRRGITAYDENGSFVFRLEGWMCPMFTAGIVATLGRIEQERVRRATFKSGGAAPVEGPATEVDEAVGGVPV